MGVAKLILEPGRPRPGEFVSNRILSRAQPRPPARHNVPFTPRVNCTPWVISW